METPRPRWIAHVDMDAFFCSVERLLNPALIGRPLVVGGSGPRSVVASASYEVRKFGVRSAMPTAQARRLCRDLVIARPQFAEYSRLSKIIFTRLADMAPAVQQVSVDEAYLDFTGCEKLYPTRASVGVIIKDEILKVSGLNSTVGIATNKLLAKVASDFAKPNGLLEVPVGSEREFLRPLAIDKIPGVGRKTLYLFERAGIKTCEDLAHKTDGWLLERFGDFILELKKRAQGSDDRAVHEERDTKSIGAEETFDTDIESLDTLAEIMRSMAEDIARDLRREKVKARTVQIKIRYGDFSTYTRAKTITTPTYISQELCDVGFRLLAEHKIKGQPLRLLGLSTRNFVPSDEPAAQMDLFGEGERTERRERVEHLKDELRTKFGASILLKPR